MATITFTPPTPQTPGYLRRNLAVMTLQNDMTAAQAGMQKLQKTQAPMTLELEAMQTAMAQARAENREPEPEMLARAQALEAALTDPAISEQMLALSQKMQAAFEAALAIMVPCVKTDDGSDPREALLDLSEVDFKKLFAALGGSPAPLVPMKNSS